MARKGFFFFLSFIFFCDFITASKMQHQSGQLLKPDNILLTGCWGQHALITRNAANYFCDGRKYKSQENVAAEQLWGRQQAPFKMQCSHSLQHLQWQWSLLLNVLQVHEGCSPVDTYHWIKYVMSAAFWILNFFFPSPGLKCLPPSSFQFLHLNDATVFKSW